MGEYLIAFILGGVAGIVIGLIVGRMGNSNADVVAKLNKELDEVKEKLRQQTEHFAESENMLHKIGTDLKDLYQHMSKNEISTLKEKFKGLVIEADAQVDEIAHKAEAVAKDTKEAVKNVKDEVAEKTAEIKDKVEEKVEVVKEKAKDAADQSKDELDKVIDELADTTEKQDKK